MGRVGVPCRHCPHCSGPRFKSQPGAHCCMSFPLSFNLFPIMSSAILSLRIQRTKNIYLKKKSKKIISAHIRQNICKYPCICDNIMLADSSKNTKTLSVFSLSKVRNGCFPLYYVKVNPLCFKLWGKSL